MRTSNYSLCASRWSDMGISLETGAFEAALRRELGSFEEEGQKYIKETAEEIASDARAHAPVETGALRDSIEVTGSGKAVEVGAHVPYAMYVEYGTSHSPPHPFMRPAMAKAAKR